MPDPTAMTVVQNKFVLTHTVNNIGDKNIELATENHFVDKDIIVKITTPSVGNITFAATDNTTDVTINTVAENGKYDISTGITGTISATAGWFSGSSSISDNSVVVGKIAQSTFTGQTITPGTAQTVTIGSGYYHTDRTVVIEPISDGAAASFSNVATAEHTYTDVSDTTFAPVLISGDYLYVDAGYVDDIKIRLAKLVPDGSDVEGHAEYILYGHSAYDNNGTLVTGNITTYNGDYTIV